MSHEDGRIKMKTAQVARGRATEDQDNEVRVVCRIALLARLSIGPYTTSCASTVDCSLLKRYSSRYLVEM